MDYKIKWDVLLTSILVACALVTTSLVVRRELAPSSAPIQVAPRKPTFIQDWKSQLEQGVRFGQLSAPVRLIEFADFECPYCGSFHRTLKALRQRYPTEVSLTYMHFPLPMHRFAIPAARVAECAGDQGRFEAMHDQLFVDQESFGLKPWSDYATAAGVPDLLAFDACVKQTTPIPRVEVDKKLGVRLDVRGTPTLIINGWMLDQPPSEEELTTMVTAVLAGKSPISGAQESTSAAAKL